MTITNPILATDSYKFSHFMQYPKGATHVSSYIEARGSKIEGVTEVVMFGLQAFINEVLSKRITVQHVEEASLFCAAHGTPFNYDGWLRIAKEHNGYLPIKIQAVPEGTPVPLHNVMIQVTNMDETMPWLTSYIESILISYVWYGSTVATVSREIKRDIKKYLDISSDNADTELPFKLHDFGYRGVAAGAAGLGGAAHLVNFMGTDTVEGILYAQENYNAGMCGFSISASEHSTMTSWGEENEYEAYKNMMASYAKPGAIFACVIDSYDTMAAIDMWATRIDPETNLTLLEQVKEAGATVVLRPDSGDPVAMPVDVIKRLMDRVGFYENSKGYRVLPDHVRVIQGDGIDAADVRAILFQLKMNRISGSCIAFGMGGGLLQKVNRDTFKFAMKANAINIDGVWKDVQKNPVTDQGKKSKAGRQILLKNKETGEYKTLRVGDEAEKLRKEGWVPGMQTVWSSIDGNISARSITFDQVRENARV